MRLRCVLPVQGGGGSGGASGGGAGDKAVENMSLRGQFLGCRAQGEGSASKNPPAGPRVSDFLSHVEEAPGYRERRRQQRRQRREQRAQQQGNQGSGNPGAVPPSPITSGELSPSSRVRNCLCLLLYGG